MERVGFLAQFSKDQDFACFKYFFIDFEKYKKSVEAFFLSERKREGGSHGLNLCRQAWQVTSVHVEPTIRVAISFIFSTLSTSSRALSHSNLARANSFSAISISLLVSSRTRSA
ncbi:unnamed protein product [Spirodela intermedia]|uniref:Uncharacterized protein n=1 Tax=Spirodela intermedia TaxID=51605 RepID=A0A7I8IQX3_SPIIN|nr:unnamed protein product [Spirodela intermedia]CAA6659936.1 unnamed protein product [Spirodela intermedia]